MIFAIHLIYILITISNLLFYWILYVFKYFAIRTTTSSFRIYSFAKNNNKQFVRKYPIMHFHLCFYEDYNSIVCFFSLSSVDWQGVLHGRLFRKRMTPNRIVIVAILCLHLVWVEYGWVGMCAESNRLKCTTGVDAISCGQLGSSMQDSSFVLVFH